VSGIAAIAGFFIHDGRAGGALMTSYFIQIIVAGPVNAVGTRVSLKKNGFEQTTIGHLAQMESNDIAADFSVGIFGYGSEQLSFFAELRVSGLKRLQDLQYQCLISVHMDTHLDRVEIRYRLFCI
jgi:hypothetical protein